MKILFAVLYLIQLLPFSAIGAIGRMIGILSYYLVAPRRRVGQINLAKCFPEWDEKPRTAVL